MDELYTVARGVLLDALEALGAHRDAIILVGAQALYLQTGDADLAVAPYTTDGDLALDPALLGEVPPLEQALSAAGFCREHADHAGVWLARRSTSHHPDRSVAVDLLVPASGCAGWLPINGAPRPRCAGSGSWRPSSPEEALERTWRRERSQACWTATK